VAASPGPQPAGRGRRRPVLWTVIAVAVLLPVTEIVVLVATVRSAGVLATLGVLLAAALFGGWLARREGMRAFRATRDALAADRVPAAEVADGLIILAGAVLLLIPGFVSDVLGIVALLPPTRRLIRRWLLDAARGRLPVEVSDTVLGPQEIRVRRVTSRRGPGRTPGEPAGGDRPKPEIVEGVVMDKPGQDTPGQGGQGQGGPGRDEQRQRGPGEPGPPPTSP
jgi:UPF0716 protein FxsA